jgi:hypothetical protein
VNGPIAVAPAGFSIVTDMRISLVSDWFDWIAQTVPCAAPHSWLAGTRPGLPVRCCMMIGVKYR